MDRVIDVGDELNNPFYKAGTLKQVVDEYLSKGGVAFHLDTKSEGDRETCYLIIKFYLALLAPPEK